MNAPPRVATWLLEAAVTATERDAIVGDLYEEYRACVLPARGVTLARWWYRWQVARSVAPLLYRSWERASPCRASVAVCAGALLTAMPASMLIMIRTYVLQQVPLKTTPDMSAAFAVTLLAVVLLGSGAGFLTAIGVINADARER